jgi:hypothetical protein
LPRRGDKSAAAVSTESAVARRQWYRANPPLAGAPAVASVVTTNSVLLLLLLPRLRKRAHGFVGTSPPPKTPAAADVGAAGPRVDSRCAGGGAVASAASSAAVRSSRLGKPAVAGRRGALQLARVVASPSPGDRRCRGSCAATAPDEADPAGASGRRGDTEFGTRASPKPVPPPLLLSLPLPARRGFEGCDWPREA